MSTSYTTDAFLFGVETQQIYSLSQVNTTIGRSKDNDLCLMDDQSMSRRHALILRVGDQFMLKDLKSSNGTVLNGHLINDALVMLKPDDEIYIGKTRMFFAPSVEKIASAKAAPKACSSIDMDQAPTTPLPSLMKKMKDVCLSIIGNSHEEDGTEPDLRETMQNARRLYKKELISSVAANSRCCK